ncbi:MAG: hypothetical protein PHT07_11085 [Paludibacter sp.]|nr:hypothetical protein [Paludibacter sp.]
MRLYTKLKIGAVLLLIPAIYTAFFPGKIVVITALCLYPILFFMFSRIVQIRQSEFDGKLIIDTYIIMCFITFVRGAIDSKSQQDYIVLMSSTIFLMLLYPLFIYLAQKKYLNNIFNILIFLIIPLCFITFFYKPSDGFMTFQQNISFIYLFIFFVPFVKRKWKLIILTLAIIAPLYDITRRSSLINISVCLAILLLYYILPNIIYRKIAKILFFILVLSPIVFLILGLGGIYNIFNLGDSFHEITLTTNLNERNLLVDSRTSIYKDVFSELSEKNAYVFGLGGVGKTKTSLTDNINSEYSRIYKEGRRGTESGMLNYFQLSGFVGALIYWVLLTFASYKAIFKSKNSFFIMFGLFMAFKVLYSFVEDQLQCNIATFYLMFYIGLCYNLRLRNLLNLQMKKYSNILFR